MDAQEITSDLNTIKACLKLIQDANSDTTKIAEQITILEDVSIVKSMIKVSYFVVITFCSAIDFGSIDFGSAINFGSTSDFRSAIDDFGAAIDFGYFIALTICIIYFCLFRNLSLKKWLVFPGIISFCGLYLILSLFLRLI